MAKLKFDNGEKCWQVGGGELRFNPRDPDLYQRFLDGVQELQALVQRPDLTLAEADRLMREQLLRIFGAGTDLAAMFPQNLLALCGNGKVLVLNFLEAVEAVLVEGARAYAAQNG